VSRTVLVIGAGYVGAALATALVAAGDRVIAVRRRAAGEAIDGVTWLVGDARTPESLDGLPTAVSHIVLSAAPSGGTAHETTYPPLARAALWLAERLGAESVVYTSSTGVYGVKDGRFVTEDTPREAIGTDAAALMHAEDLLLASTAVRTVVLRVAGIYGPGRTAMARFRDASRLSARGQYWTNFAHRDDIVTALRLALDTRTMRGAYNCADGSPMLALDVAQTLAGLEGRPWHAPAWGDDSGPPSRSNQRIVTTRLVQAGFVPRYPSVRDGFAALLRDAAPNDH
jgi:nucleoside-diphosphate-sugar epimerase